MFRTLGSPLTVMELQICRLYVIIPCLTAVNACLFFVCFSGQVSSIDVDPDTSEAKGGRDQAESSVSASNDDPAVTNGAHNRSIREALPQSDAKRRKSEPDKKWKPARPQQQQKTPKRKTGPKKASTRKKAAPSKSESGKGKSSLKVSEGGAAKINPHRAKILVGKQALAAIKGGTRLFIKSGEGNGGDTWWDSGIIEKIHDRGKPYEVEWEKFNNRGEEVDTGVEKRIILPVTYSLAGAAAEAMKTAAPGTEAAARERVLVDARIGSWCIRHPEEPWGTLDPFNNDSTPTLDPELVELPV
ncbi:unnamed protein product [Pylaiella littoralis]